MHLAQIGSGGHLFYVGSGLNGTEATHGNIQGDVSVDADGILNLGTSASADAPNDRYIIQSQVGHGGHIRMDYDETDITGDSSLDAVHGQIASFDTGIGRWRSTRVQPILM